eukprot:TRINITY_DN19500_c1_g1_i1.p6 TRINITY_DN19500_c1_g1~~TRINITY_DN19500_c1_g1_i1.p6  ORF type:complete len:159 (-),score=2.53 TRINITY_DN19500_c1_g1_i1:553-1029(-)
MKLENKKMLNVQISCVMFKMVQACNQQDNEENNQILEWELNLYGNGIVFIRANCCTALNQYCCFGMRKATCIARSPQHNGLLEQRAIMESWAMQLQYHSQAADLLKANQASKHIRLVIQRLYPCSIIFPFLINSKDVEAAWNLNVLAKTVNLKRILKQ